MGGHTDGYTVKSGVAGQANELDGAGNDTGKIRQAVRPGLCYPDDALGGPDSAAAFNAFAAAWEAEAGTLESALHELADKTRLSKKAYGDSDGAVGTRAHAVPAGGGALTTMPTRAGTPVPAAEGGATTMPAHAPRPSALADY
ncbi:hypothetical protein OIB37_16760 [Streptomyces sp. NBC_00820]|uniref:hypothetical protein n=1 Tax=Streptomyces sp. NBC_00820 TaxID=2975842 RepID=UPI002ED10D32|nr:hypothetical protein OIB37_16760 [Streptomyces sp. NBC_00820]